MTSRSPFLFWVLAAWLLSAWPSAAKADEATVLDTPTWLPWENCTIAVGNERDGFMDQTQGRIRYSDPKTCEGRVQSPFLAKIPDEDKILLLLTCGESAPHTCLLASTDECETWQNHNRPGDDSFGWGGLTCCGNGVMLICGSNCRSTDGGHHWDWKSYGGVERFGTPAYEWDPGLVDPKSNGRHIYMASYYMRNFHWPEAKTEALMRESFDAGETWTEHRGIPEFAGACEVALAYNAQGEIVAAMRASTLMAPTDDHADRLEYSYSKDGGRTWAPPKVVAGNGRHHPSMALLPDGRMVMSYVVRLGYPREPDGKQAYGIEAVVSSDGGHTWDTDHRYVLSRWTSDCMVTDDSGRTFQVEHYMFAPQCTSTLYLPKSDCLVTVYGTFQNARRFLRPGESRPYQVAMVKWKPLDSYSQEKAAPPPALTAAAALARLRANPYWSVNYVAANGLPDCGWINRYPEQALSLHDGWLRMDHRNLGTSASINARGVDHMERVNGPVGLRLKARGVECDDGGKPLRLIIYSVLSCGRDKYSFHLFITRDANVQTSFGDFTLPVGRDTSFTLETYADPATRHAYLWLDGQLVADTEFTPQYEPPEAPARLYIGHGSAGIGGIVEVADFKFGQVK